MGNRLESGVDNAMYSSLIQCTEYMPAADTWAALELGTPLPLALHMGSRLESGIDNAMYSSLKQCTEYMLLDLHKSNRLQA